MSVLSLLLLNNDVRCCSVITVRDVFCVIILFGYCHVMLLCHYLDVNVMCLSYRVATFCHIVMLSCHCVILRRVIITSLVC